MKKRIAPILIASLITISSVFCLSGCKKSDNNFPVTIGHTKISQKPQNVAVLSDNLADIILYMDEFESQICAISDACTQPELTEYLDSVGSETNPDVDAIVESGAEYVLTDTPLPDKIADGLDNKGVTVINLMHPETKEQLERVYKTLGTLFGGKTDGKDSGESSYERLFNTLETAVSETEGSDVVKTACYLYLDNDGQLCTFNGTDCFGMVMDYIGAMNISKNFDTVIDNIDAFNLSNPNYIFYDNAEVLEYLKSHPDLSTFTALKEGHTVMIPKHDLERMGETLIATQNRMLSAMFDSIPENNPSISEDAKKSYAKEYGIELKADTTYSHNDEAEDIKIIQKRLVDLEYLVLDDEPTIYFGSKTEQAIRDFQSANGINSTGIANYTTLEKLFLASTLSKSGVTVAPEKTAVQTPEPTTPAESTTTPTTPSDVPEDKVYNIDLTNSKEYGIRRDLNQADVHEDVMVIQERLHDLGFFTPPEGGYTKNFLEGTEKAFMEFEKAYGLEVDGYADYEDLKVLFPNN